MTHVPFTAWLGLIGGIVFGCVGWFGGQYSVRRAGNMDERWKQIHLRAKADAWGITAWTMAALAVATMAGVKMNPIAMLGILWAVSCGSWGVMLHVHNGRQ